MLKYTATIAHTAPVWHSVVTQRTITNGAVFQITSDSHDPFLPASRSTLTWNGHGSRLWMVFGDSLTSIDHPSASDSYGTIKAARAVAAAFACAVAGHSA